MRDAARSSQPRCVVAIDRSASPAAVVERQASRCGDRRSRTRRPRRCAAGVRRARARAPAAACRRRPVRRRPRSIAQARQLQVRRDQAGLAPRRPAAAPAATPDCCCSSARPAHAEQQRDEEQPEAGRQHVDAAAVERAPAAIPAARGRASSRRCAMRSRAALAACSGDARHRLSPPAPRAGSPWPARRRRRLGLGHQAMRGHRAEQRLHVLGQHVRRDPAATHRRAPRAATRGRRAATGRRARPDGGGCARAAPARSRSAHRWRAPR